MPWNEADRAKYDVIRERYSSDLSDAEFALIFPLLPAPKRRGRKPTRPRDILNALFYLIRSGCPWRLLPKDFPPFTTVQNRFYAWRDSGLWTQIVCVLVMGAREAEGRDAAPTAVVVDSQSVKTTEAGGPRGFDAAKKIKGRKRHVAVDTLGLPIECQITPADRQDRDALASVLRETRRKSPFVTMSFVDSGYKGDEAQRAAFEASRQRRAAQTKLRQINRSGRRARLHNATARLPLSSLPARGARTPAASRNRVTISHIDLQTLSRKLVEEVQGCLVLMEGRAFRARG